MGKHVPRQWVLPIFGLTVAFFGLLVSFPFHVLAIGTIIFLVTIPLGAIRYRHLDRTLTETKPAGGPAPSAPDAPLS
jgi:CDP-diacylglycerol--serine O-phosphatidyltransferase